MDFLNQTLNQTLADVPKSCHLNSLPSWRRFEVGKLCGGCNVTLNCQTTFNPDGSVATIGGVARGGLKVDGDDIAGVGIIVSFFLPSVISLLISLILISSSVSGQGKGKGKKGGLKGMIPRPGHGGFSERAYNSLESILRAISDIQILLALALAMSIVVFGICRTIQYHFEIGINLLLLACANYLQTLGLTRHYWRSWPAALAAFIRLLAVIGIYFCFGWILAIQNSSPDTLRKHQFVAERMPGENKTDSVVFLKAACFLDPYFQNNTFVPLEPAKRTSIGVHENKGRAPEWIFGIMLILLTGITLITCLVQVFRGPPKTSKRMTALHSIYYSSIWLLSLAVLGYSAATIFGLRSWVSKSGWLEPVEMGNPDDSVRGFGQTAALVLLAAMVIAALENASVTVTKTVKQKKASKGKYGKVKQHV